MGYLDEEGIDFRSEETSAKPWYRGFLGGNQAIESLKKVAAALSQEYELKIVIKEGEDAVAHSDSTTKTITLGTKGIYTKGSDFYVGLLLHEIAHIRHSPPLEGVKEVREFKNPIIAASMYNLLEDRRIEEKMKDDYSGAFAYFDVINGDMLNRIRQQMGSKLYSSHRGINDWIRTKVEEKHHAGGFTSTTDEGRTGEMAAYREELKEQLLYKTCALAIMINEAMVEYDSSTECDEADKMAEAVSHRIRESANANLTDAETLKLTMEVLNILDPLIPTKKHSEDKKKAQGEGEGGGAHGRHGKHAPGEELVEGMTGGGRGTVPSYGRLTRHDNYYSQADARIIPQADSLKRKLVAVMRENERSKYVGGKRRGLLNKKALNRVARDNYRIYRKRFEPKGRKYAVAIVEDCSGSMWGYAGRTSGRASRMKIESAHEVTALFTRVFRALGFPVGVTIYGHQARTVLQPRDMYIAEAVNRRMIESNDFFYHSGGNETHKGIKNALEYLNKAGAGKQKLMIIITDGGLDTSDVRASRVLLEKEMKKGSFSPMLFYVESQERILDNPEYEAHIPEPSTQLATEAVRLMKKIVVPLQDIE